MYRKANLLFLKTETPLHVGSGQDLGIVDLPIQRERHTGFPKIEASSLKGSIREAFEKGIDTFNIGDATIQINREPDNKDLHVVFGPEGDNAHAGAIGFSDARILLFPVKSMKGVFAWITCPMVLEQFKKDMQIIDEKFKMNIPNKIKENKIKENECYTDSSALKIAENVILEEYTFKVKGGLQDLTVNEQYFGEWLAEHLKDSQWSEKLKKDIVVLNDDDFKDFVNLSTEVITRTKIDNKTGTVETGALWTEEYLPAETVMYSLVFATDLFLNEKLKEGYSESILVKNKRDKAEDVMKFVQKGFETLNNFIQIGANATLGKGLTHLKLINNE